jgi:hypothetical protein
MAAAKKPKRQEPRDVLDELRFERALYGVMSPTATLFGRAIEEIERLRRFVAAKSQ